MIWVALALYILGLPTAYNAIYHSGKDAGPIGNALAAALWPAINGLVLALWLGERLGSKWAARMLR